ncbi:MAG: DUF5686 and carboxypeptidase regulatory-like domain-containing protein [Bacteroidia bacterium]|nr:DUF5686 and carboxypeptidase regulatory-like domain-containing protein [Bacteroidia bacterium]
MRHLLLCGWIWGQVFSISGEIKNPEGEPLGHVIIRLPQTGFQTVSSADGRFTLSAALDTLILELRHLGYRLRRDTLYRTEGQKFYSFILYPQEVRLGGIIITEAGKDPGEVLVRRAIAVKDQNQQCLLSFRTETYTLFTLRWLEPPNSLLRKLAKLPEGQKDVLFMSETFSHIFFAAPDKYHEDIVRSRIVGTQRYSFLGGWIFQGFNPYAERLTLQEMTETPFVLPLARDAPIYYRYRLVGSYWDEENLFYKVAVEPRSAVSPCVEGYMLIADESYALVGLEWYVKPPRPLRYTDSIGVRVTYVPVGKCYQIGELSFRGHFRLSVPVGRLSLTGEGYAAYRKYQVLIQSKASESKTAAPSPSLSPKKKPKLPPAPADTVRREAPIRPETVKVERINFGEFVRILPEASEASAAFWDSLRAAPLDSAQVAYLSRHDTMVAAQETLSSKVRSRFGLVEGGIGWSRQKSKGERSTYISAGQKWVSYTPLEGWVLPLQATYKVRNEGSALEFVLTGRYGLRWRRFLPAGQIVWNTRHYPRWRWYIGGGIQVREPTDFIQIPSLWNIAYYLLGEEPLWQGYVRPFAVLGFGRYLHRTVEIEARAGWDRRLSSPQASTTYEGWRGAVWMTWRPGTRLFRTPRSTQFIPPDKVLTWQVSVATETAWLTDQLLVTVSGGVKPVLSISPFGRLELEVHGSWQNRLAPWADRLYVRVMPPASHRGFGEFVGWGPYESIGRWAPMGIVSWFPEGALVRLIPLLRRTSWQEALTFRGLRPENSPWHVEGSFFLHQLNFRLRKTGVARPLSIGFHAVLIGREKRGFITLGLGDLARSLVVSKLTPS